MSSPDGLTVEFYQAGLKYDLPEHLAQAYIANRFAEEDKDMGGPPEVKDDDYEWPWGKEPSAQQSPVILTKKHRKKKK
jgi:hypothetical protein